MLSHSPVARVGSVPRAPRQRRAAARWLAPILALVGMMVGATALADTLDDRAAAWSNDDARIIARAAPRLIDGAIAPTFEAMDRRVGAYADWVYGWFSSLLTAWDLAAVGAIEAQQEISAGRFPDPGAVYDRLAKVVQERFDGTVAHAEGTEMRIVQAWDRTMARLAALDARLAAERRVRIRTLARRLGADPAPALDRYGGPLLAASAAGRDLPAAAVRHALSGVEDGAGGTTDRVLVRSLRPLATRAVSVTTRLLLAPVIGGVVASPVAGTNGLLAAAATLATISAGIWGVDYAANRLDSALTRPDFEATLRSLVRDTHARTSRILRARAESAVCAALTDPTACAALQPVAAPQPRG